MKKKCNCGCGKYATPEDRFWQKVKKTDTCWNWKAELDKNGYGKIAIHRIGIRAHRFSYELHKGKIPVGFVIDHLCRNTSCVNPEHLEVVTNRENILRGNGPASINAKKNCCIHGHELFGENLYINKKTNQRACKICVRRHGRNYARKKRKTKNDNSK